jgi:predicted amidophosphoribosyltransferase
VSTRPKPAGFGNCGRCPYRSQGTAEICFSCASASFERLANDRCALCELPLSPEALCGNPLCNWDEQDRYFAWVWAISMRTGPLRRAIDRYKVDERRGWAAIFGRVLLGYLEAKRGVFGGYDLIVPSPTYVGEGGRTFDHTALVVERAAEEDDGEWPFALGVLEKVTATTAFRGKTWRRRYEISEDELRPALKVRRPKLVSGKRVLVYDDVYTEGLTLRAVARCLREAGATEISEVVLARQPYGGSV